MVGIERDEEGGRALLLLPQMIIWPFVVRLIKLAKEHWRGVLNYQALSDQPSLPLGVQDSQHMMMTAVSPNRIKKLLNNG